MYKLLIKNVDSGEEEIKIKTESVESDKSIVG
jgi:hypothetical protein